MQTGGGLGALIGDMLERGSLEDTVSVVNLGVGALAGILGYFLVSRPAAIREQRIERSQAYLELELASIETFKYKAEHWYALNWALTNENPKRVARKSLEEAADQYFYQCLNLFEISSRFRKVGIIDPQIYASWVAWFYEALEVPYFRRQWPLEYRDNYTPELQDIFDAGVRLWEAIPADAPPDSSELGRVGPEGGPTDRRRRLFYQYVGWIVACPVIAGWHGRETERIGLLGRIRRARHGLNRPEIG